MERVFLDLSQLLYIIEMTTLVDLIRLRNHGARAFMPGPGGRLHELQSAQDGGAAGQRQCRCRR